MIPSVDVVQRIAAAHRARDDAAWDAANPGPSVERVAWANSVIDRAIGRR